MWNAQYVSKEIYCILGEKSTGSVHSIFNRSFNIMVNDRMIHMGASENGMAPFGIGIDQLDAQMLIRKLRLGQTVQWNTRSQALHFMSGDVVSLRSATVTDHLLPAYSFDQTILQKNFTYLAATLSSDEWQTGIVQTNAEKQLLIDYLKNKYSTSPNHPVLAEFQKLYRLIGNQNKEAVPIFNYWIGRGTGLTPSGDDILTGLCAVFTGFAQSHLHWMEQLDLYVKNYGNERTTAVSVAYLSSATRHMFHSQLIRVIEGLLQPDEQLLSVALEDMQKMGHTSGTDTLIGILAGTGAVLSEGLNK